MDSIFWKNPKVSHEFTDVNIFLFCVCARAPISFCFVCARAPISFCFVCAHARPLVFVLCVRMRAH